MGDQNEKVNGSNPTLAAEGDGTDICVVDQIRNQKQGGHDQRCNHAVLVRLDVLSLDEVKTETDQHRSREVKYGVESGQIADRHRAIREASWRRRQAVKELLRLPNRNTLVSGPRDR